MQNSKRYQYRRSIMLLCRVAIFGVVCGLFYLVWSNFYQATMFFRKGNYLMMLIYGFLYLSFSMMYGGFRIGQIRLGELIYSSSLALLIVNGLMYLQLSLLESKLLPIWPVIGLFVGQFVGVGLLCSAANRIYYTIYPVRQVVLICRDKENALRLKTKIDKVPERFEMKEILLQDCAQEEMQTAINGAGCVMLGDIDLNLRKQISDYCYDKEVRVYVIPNVEDILLNTSVSTQIFDTPVLLSKNYQMSNEQKILKRATDVLIAAVALVLGSPFMLLTALAIKLHDKGPVFYGQVRSTEGGRTFRLLKFRSMVQNAEKDGVARLSSKNDSRITPVGKVIRATRLDELPQLLNILKGDMSVVGPRPERPEIIEEYLKKFPEFKYRTKMKAGLTGYAQVMGKYNTSPQDKLLLDLLYIEKYSLWLDFKLMMLTVKILFMKESTEGIEDGDITA